MAEEQKTEIEGKTFAIVRQTNKGFNIWIPTESIQSAMFGKKQREGDTNAKLDKEKVETETAHNNKSTTEKTS